MQKTPRTSKSTSRRLEADSSSFRNGMYVERGYFHVAWAKSYNEPSGAGIFTEPKCRRKKTVRRSPSN
jgi:hypothetical protein